MNINLEFDKILYGSFLEIFETLPKWPKQARKLIAKYVDNVFKMNIALRVAVLPTLNPLIILFVNFTTRIIDTTVRTIKRLRPGDYDKFVEAIKVIASRK